MSGMPSGQPNPSGGTDLGTLNPYAFDPYSNKDRPEYAAYLKSLGMHRDATGQLVGPDAALTYNQWKALTGSMPTTPTTPPTPPTPPTVPPALEGLIAQTADPFAVYGQMGVMEPYLSALNQRFGWDPSGVAYGQALNPSLPTWYQPRTIYPEVILPKISGGGTTGTSSTKPIKW